MLAGDGDRRSGDRLFSLPDAGLAAARAQARRRARPDERRELRSRLSRAATTSGRGSPAGSSWRSPTSGPISPRSSATWPAARSPRAAWGCSSTGCSRCRCSSASCSSACMVFVFYLFTPAAGLLQRAGSRARRRGRRTPPSWRRWTGATTAPSRRSAGRREAYVAALDAERGEAAGEGGPARGRRARPRSCGTEAEALVAKAAPGDRDQGRRLRLHLVRAALPAPAASSGC